MASSPASQSAGKPKQMSSRLATMKFMQRAAASTPSSPLTPSGSARSGFSTPNSQLDDGPPSKRFKSSRLSDAQDVLNSPTPARFDAETSRRVHTTQFGSGAETKWAFATKHDVVVPEAGEFRVEVLNGRHSDASDDDEEPGISRTEKSQGRKVYGSKKKHNPSKQDTANNAESDGSDSDSSEDSVDSIDRQARKILDASEFRKDSSIVSRSNRISGAINMDRIQCHNCKEFGHMYRHCPKGGAKRYS